MSIKHEEMVPLADMVWASFKRGRGAIEAENSTFTPQYLDDFKAMIDEVRDLEQLDSLLVTQKGITTQLYLSAEEMKKDIKLFHFVLKKAELDTSIASVLLKNISTKNIEGALVNIKSIEQIIASNTNSLLSKGMKASLPNFLGENFTKLTTLSNQQNQIMKDRKILTEGNHGSYTTLRKYITDVCKIGKTIYNGSVKAEEYNIQKLVTKLHTTAHKLGGNLSPVL